MRTNIRQYLPGAQRLLCASLLLLAGCTTSRFEETMSTNHGGLTQRAEQANALLRSYPAPTPSVVQTQKTRFTTHSIPLDRSEMLPSHITSVTLRLPGRHSIQVVAGLIERATQISVHVSPDARMPASMFVPVGMTQTAQAGSSQRPLGAASDSAVLDSVSQAGGARLSPELDPSKQNDLEINYSGTLAGLLNLVAMRSDLRWSYESGRILFYRVVTRTIAVKTMPGGLKMSATLSLSSSGGGNSSSNIASEINVWSGIEKNLSSMLSVSGRLVIDSNTGTIMVRDAFRNVELVEQYIQSLNQNLMRQVAMTVEVLQINLKTEFQSGVDWNYVSDTMRMGRLQLRGPTAVASADAASSIGFVLSRGAGVTNQLLFQALEKFGRVSSSYSTVVTTVNRQPVPVGNQTTQSYLKSVTPTLLTNAGTGAVSYGAPSLTPGEITTGFSLTLLPIVLDSNQILVECGLSLSSLNSLVAFNTGSGSSLQTIQQPSITNFGILQRLIAKSNETIVLSGFDSEVLSGQQADPLVKLPGSREGSKMRTTTVVLITPRLLD